MNLSNYCQGRNNNFNLIRIVAALAVLVSHSFSLVTGSGDTEPFQKSLGMSVGAIAVDLFFIASGFLVTSSLLKRQSIIEFVWARVLRIYPALLLTTFLTVFVLGPLFTALPISAYFSLPEAYKYLVKNTILFMGVHFTLPGVFDSNPWKSAVNGSLWTIVVEVRMYAVLTTIWIVLRVTPKLRLTTFKLAVVSIAFLAGICLLANHFYFHYERTILKLFFLFFFGAAFYVLRERILLSHGLFWLLVISLFIAAILDKYVFFVVYVLAISYILFYLAYIPSGFIRKYNRLGDYSYGIYIYAYPVQQAVAALVPSVSVPQMILFSASVTIVLAIFSWHLLESRCLGLIGSCVEHTRKLLTFGLTRREAK
jgi:peptidoglycan/LPS O-acetylase OafA/YrhL